jgi:hypothetical protein
MQLTVEMIVQLIVLLILMALASGAGMLAGVLLDWCVSWVDDCHDQADGAYDSGDDAYSDGDFRISVSVLRRSCRCLGSVSASLGNGKLLGLQRSLAFGFFGVKIGLGKLELFLTPNCLDDARLNLLLVRPSNSSLKRSSSTVMALLIASHRLFMIWAVNTRAAYLVWVVKSGPLQSQSASPVSTQQPLRILRPLHR